MGATYVQGGTLNRVHCVNPLTPATAVEAAKITLCSRYRYVSGCDRCAGKRHSNKTVACSATFTLRSPVKAAPSSTLFELATHRRIPGLWRLELEDVSDTRQLGRTGVIRRIR